MRRQRRDARAVLDDSSSLRRQLVAGLERDGVRLDPPPTCPIAAEAVLEGRAPEGDRRSTLGRVLDFAARHTGDVEATKAYARLELIKMERGISYLDTIYAAAPLIGLIGTVTGLLGAFSVVDPQTRMPDPVQFTESVGYALSATVLGLCIALPALIGRLESQSTKAQSKPRLRRSMPSGLGRWYRSPPTSRTSRPPCGRTRGQSSSRV